MVTAGRIRAIDSADKRHIKQEVRWERRLVSLSSMPYWEECSYPLSAALRVRAVAGSQRIGIGIPSIQECANDSGLRNEFLISWAIFGLVP